MPDSGNEWTPAQVQLFIKRYLLAKGVQTDELDKVAHNFRYITGEALWKLSEEDLVRLVGNSNLGYKIYSELLGGGTVREQELNKNRPAALPRVIEAFESTNISADDKRINSGNATAHSNDSDDKENFVVPYTRGYSSVEMRKTTEVQEPKNPLSTRNAYRNF